jgi:branched-chain amino acid transport system ATP-binding protein
MSVMNAEVEGSPRRLRHISAVKGISFEVAAGETVCLIGANGAGKTTTLKALARLLPARGDMHYDGHSILHRPPHELIGGMTLVPEGRGVFARLTVAENLDMGAYCRNDKAEIAADLDRVFGLLPRLKERASSRWPARSPAASSRCWPSAAR